MSSSESMGDSATVSVTLGQGGSETIDCAGNTEAVGDINERTEGCCGSCCDKEPVKAEAPKPDFTAGIVLGAGGVLLILFVGLLTGIVAPGKTASKPEDLVYAESLLRSDLYEKGLVADVDCKFLSSTLEPFCDATVTPKNGGATSGPLHFVGDHSSKLTWRSY